MKIETKFEIGDWAWFMWDNKPVKDRIETMMITVNYPKLNPIDYNRKTVGILYSFSNNRTAHQPDVFSTKEELIASL
jgi:hypothetical protein